MADGDNMNALWNWYQDQMYKQQMEAQQAEPNRVTEAIVKALQAGQAAPVLGKDGQVTGFNYGNINLPEGLSTTEALAALQAALGTAAQSASMQNQNAATLKLENLLGSIKNSPELAQYRKTIESALATPAVASGNFGSSANAINAWADRQIATNAQNMARQGKAGSSTAMDNASKVNMLRGEKLGDAILKSKQAQNNAVQQDIMRKASLAQNLFSTATNPEMALQKALAQLFSSNTYSAPAINWAVSTDPVLNRY